MKKFIKWFMESSRNKILFFSYSFAIVLVYFLFNAYLKLHQKEIQQTATESIEERIQVNSSSIYIDGDEVYKFVYVLGGSMIVPDSSSRRAISVRSFRLGEIEVSNRLLAFVLRNETVPDNSAEKLVDFPANSGTKENWLMFIDKLNKITGHKFRLPTNDEWEYAARGGRLSNGYKYAGGNNIDEVALYKGNTKDIGNVASRLKLPNELGLYDMSGSMWELTSTPITDLDYQNRLNNKVFLAHYEEAKQQHPEEAEIIKQQILSEPFVARGGAYDSSEEECMLNYISTKTIPLTGARIVMEY